MNPEESILCRASVQLAPTATGVMMYMPGGVQTITPFGGGDGLPIKVLVDATGAAELQRQHGALAARGKRPFFDFNHEDGPASFWPSEFFYAESPEPGIYCRGEWTATGKAGVDGKEWRQFSPVFHVDNKRGNPARIVCRERAKPNMGGLVNDPAFHTILPLWARDSSGSAAGENQNQNANTDTMNDQELAALRAKNQELETELSALRAKNDDAAAIAAKASELRAVKAEIAAEESRKETEALKAKAAKLEADAATRAEADADAAVTAAVNRGAIAAKDEATKAKWKALICADATAAALLAAIPGSQVLSGRITPGANAAAQNVQVGRISAKEAVQAYGALMAKQKDASTLEEKIRISREAGAIYAAELRNNESFYDMPIVAANALGTLSGTLISQRTLELLKFQFPMLNSITADFSDQQALYAQVVTTRIITPPTVGTYSTSTGYAQTDVTGTDVSITINNHKHVQTTLNANNMASTARRLFDEFAPANAYAMAKNMVDALYALLTTANYSAESIITLANFVRNDVIDLNVALTLAGCPEGAANRTLLLYPTYYGKLSKDASATLNVVTALAAFQRPEIMTEGILPNVEGFRVISAPNLPDLSENLTGVAFTKSALALATRLPQDYTQALPGASFGNVSVVTNPDTGMSVMQVEYVNHDLGTANQRMAWMYGVAVGQAAAAKRIVSAA